MMISKNRKQLIILFFSSWFWISSLLAQSFLLDSLIVLSDTTTTSQKIQLKNRIQKKLNNIENPQERLAYTAAYYEAAIDTQDSLFLAHSTGQFALINAVATDTFKYHFRDNRLNSSSFYEDLYLQESENYVYNFIEKEEVSAYFKKYRILQSQYGIHLSDLPKTDVLDLYPALQIFKDQSNTLNFENVLTHPSWFGINNTQAQASWYKSNNTLANFDPKAIYWIKLKIHGNEQIDTCAFFVENIEGFTSWNHIQAYLVHEDGKIEQQQTGIAMPLAEKQFSVYNNLVSFSITAKEKATLYIKLDGAIGKRKPIAISLLGTRNKDFSNNKPYQADGSFEYESPLTPYKGNKIDIRKVFIDTSQQQNIDYISKHWEEFSYEDGYDIKLNAQHSYWTKIQLIGNETFNGTQLFHLSPYPFVGADVMSFDYIDYYSTDELGRFRHQRTGYKIPLVKRPYYLWTNFLKVDVPANDTLDLFIRLTGVNPRFRAHRLDLWHIDPASVFPNQMNEAIKNTLYYGILGIQFLFFLLLFIIDKERIHFYFSIIVLGIFLSQGFNEDNYRYFVPFPSFRDWHSPLFFTGLFLVQLGFLKFTSTYFDYGKTTFVNRFFIPIFLLSSAIVNLYSISQYRYTEIGSIPLEHYFYILAILFLLFGIIAAFLIGILAPRKKSISKFFFLIAFFPGIFIMLIFLLSVVLNGLFGEIFTLSLLPTYLLTYDAAKISNILMLLLFALSTGYRTYLLKISKEHALEQNVKDQRTIIENLKQTNHLEELNRLKTRFFTNITHELRTPLTVILGISQQKDHPQAMNLIQRNGQKLLNLVNELLDLSKLDLGHLQPNYQQIEIVAFTKYIGESFQSLVDRKGIQLTIYSEIKDLWLDMDEEKYQQIISNLLSNAIKFTSENGKIILHVFERNQSLVVKIIDNGIGIAPNEIPYIFNRFYQVENSASKVGKGTGIGLALVKELVDLMGGIIQVKSKVGRGTTFELQFAIRQIAERRSTQFEPLKVDATIVSETIPMLANNSVPKNLPKLLIIEDNPDVVVYIQSVLQQHYELYTANDGEVGIIKAIEHIPDLIISDVMMPKKDGFEVVATLKQDERTSHIPIVLLTAKATQQDRLTGLKYGADAYLMKPFDKVELLVRLDNLLIVSQQLQAKYSMISAPQIIIQKEKTLETIFLEKLQKVLEIHFKESALTVNQIAAFLQMNYTQFNRKLKALTNQTPTKYLRAFRLEKAKKLLKDPTNKLNVSEVAYAVGFTDPNYFSRSFGEVYGQSPNSIRT